MFSPAAVTKARRLVSKPGDSWEVNGLGRLPLGMAFLAAATGILLDRLGLPPLIGGFLAGSGGLLATFAWYRARTGLCSIFLGVAVCGLGAVWHYQCWNLFPANHVARWLDREPRPILAQIQILDAPRVTENDRLPGVAGASERMTRCRVQFEAIRNGREWQPATGMCHLRVQGELSRIQPGDRCEIAGTLIPVGKSLVPASPSPEDYLRSRRALCSLAAECPESVRILRRESAWNPRWWIPRFRAICSARITKFVPRRHGELAQALFLGLRDNVDRELVDTFLVTGTIHLLSISGLHVGILAMAVAWTMARVTQNERWAVGITAVTTLLYALLVGGGAPIVRATILVLVFSLATIWKQPRMSMNSLAAAGLIVLALNPTQLFDIGAQLSFLAVATLAILATLSGPRPQQDPLTKLIRSKESPGMGFIRWSGMRIQRGAWIGFLIWLVTLPLVMYQFHVVSWLAALLNLVLSPPFTMAMIFGFILLSVGWLLWPLGYAAGWIVGLALDLVVALAKVGEDFYLSHHWVAGPSWPAVLVFYGSLGMGFFCYRRLRTWGLGLGASYAMFLAVWFVPNALELTPLAGNGVKPLRCTVLAMGHGGCTVIDFPDGQRLIYDAGGLGQPRVLANMISRYLWSQPQPTSNTLMISHADWDHCCAVPLLLERFPVHTAWISSRMYYSADPGTQDLCKQLADHVHCLRCVSQGERILPGDPSRIRVLSPEARGRYGSDNASSVVLLLEEHGQRVLLTGDLEQEGLEQLLKMPRLDVDVLVAPHHGSPLSNPEGLFEWCQPEWIVISGSRASQARARAIYSQFPAKVLHTADVGSVQIELSLSGIAKITTHTGR